MRPVAKAKSPSKHTSTGTIGFEAKLWLAADKLCNNIDAAEPSGARQPARQGSPQREHCAAHQYFVNRYASAEGMHAFGYDLTLAQADRNRHKRGGR